MAKQTINYQDVVDNVINELLENGEWDGRFAGYADDIEKYGDEYSRKRKYFRVKAPLYAYTSISKVGGSCQYDLRFKGQSVATVSVDKTGPVTISTVGKDKSNEGYFGCTSKHQLPDNTNWDNPKAIGFRKHFRDISSSVKAKSPEHSHESMLLSHFRKSKSGDKKILNIQPVLLSGQFFQMPTAISASKTDKIKHSRDGGGIDILARVRKGSQSTLTIIELKDEKNWEERPEIAIKQAIAYATFILFLLRSKSGDKWWKIFRFGGNVPEELTVYAVVAMPGIKEEDRDFVGEELKVVNMGRDKIKLYHITYSEQNYELQHIETSIPECK